MPVGNHPTGVAAGTTPHGPRVYVTNAGTNAVNTSSTGFQPGWTAGGGIEWAFAPRWSVKGEYLHYKTEDQKIGGTFGAGGATIQFFNVRNSGDLVRAGVNYHF